MMTAARDADEEEAAVVSWLPPEEGGYTLSGKMLKCWGATGAGHGGLDEYVWEGVSEYVNTSMKL